MLKWKKAGKTVKGSENRLIYYIILDIIIEIRMLQTAES